MYFTRHKYNQNCKEFPVGERDKYGSEVGQGYARSLLFRTVIAVCRLNDAELIHIIQNRFQHRSF